MSRARGTAHLRRSCPDCSARWSRNRLTHDEICPAVRSVDAASAEDRSFFQRHPGVRVRYRPAAPGEFADLLPGVPGLMVEVTSLRPGVRARRPYLPGEVT